MSQSHNPGRASTTGLACSPFAHRYSGNRGCFLFLRVLRCFSSPGWLPLAGITELALRWVAPFGHPGITACVRLPRAYRSLPRPSSPSRAKASTVRLFALDLKSSSYFCLGVIPQTPRHHASVVKEPNWMRVGTRAGDTRGLSAAGLAARAYSTLQKGGDPAAGSPTATLLRLRPSH